MSADNLYTRKGIYYARIQIGGGDIRRSLQTRNEREARRRLKAFLAQNTAFHGTTRRTWEEAAGAWTVATAAQRKAKTWTRYALSLRVLGRTFEGLYLDQIDKAAVMAYVAARKLAEVSIATIRRDLTALAGVMELAVENEWIQANPVRAIPKRSMRYKPPVFVRPSDDDVQAMIACLYGKVMPDYARFVLATGMRRDEALYLKRSQIDARRKSARLDDTKNSSVRVVSLDDEALAIIKRLPVNAASPDAIFCKPSDEAGGKPGGEPYTRPTEMFREANMRAAKKAQEKAQRIPARVMIHDLRHLYAIRYLERGGNLYALQLQLGHGSIRQTEWYLRFLTPEAALAAKSAAGTKSGT